MNESRSLSTASHYVDHSHKNVPDIHDELDAHTQMVSIPHLITLDGYVSVVSHKPRKQQDSQVVVCSEQQASESIWTCYEVGD